MPGAGITQLTGEDSSQVLRIQASALCPWIQAVHGAQILATYALSYLEFYPNPLPIFLAVYSGHGTNPESPSGACKSKHCSEPPPCNRLPRAHRSLPKRGCKALAHAGGSSTLNSDPAQVGRGRKQLCLRLLGDRASSKQTGVPLKRLRIRSPCRTQKLMTCEAPFPLTWRRASDSIYAGSTLKQPKASATWVALWTTHHHFGFW